MFAVKKKTNADPAPTMTIEDQWIAANSEEAKLSTRLEQFHAVLREKQQELNEIGARLAEDIDNAALLRRATELREQIANAKIAADGTEAALQLIRIQIAELLPAWRAEIERRAEAERLEAVSRIEADALDASRNFFAAAEKMIVEATRLRKCREQLLGGLLMTASRSGATSRLTAAHNAGLLALASRAGGFSDKFAGNARDAWLLLQTDCV